MNNPDELHPRRIELLAPARNAEVGREAILHGADAVYIGAPRFGARAAAGCSVDDIARLCDFAHRYNARVYVALNTILYDNELADAARIARSLYRAQADALIVQDLALLRLDLPPIALHASTQCDNRTADKVNFLAAAGFSQVVLARELSLDEIRGIAASTQVSLEAFVHGALCVSYSGQCYLSAALTGRSANRGECAQCCRLPYTLIDGNGREVLRDRHLLSLKDLNLSSRLEALLDAGVSSLKIEGRLKDVGYVKNVTAYYRAALDEILARRYADYCRASDGVSEVDFTPDVYKSFNRGFTTYFFDRQPVEPLINRATPKSIGEPVGKVTAVRDSRTFTYDGTVPLNNGDGLCFIDDAGNFSGFRLNRAEGGLLYSATPLRLSRGLMLYRNKDCRFDAQLARPTARRYVPVDIHFYELPDGFALDITDGNITTTHRCPLAKTPARVPQRARIVAELGKLGNTCFAASHVRVTFSQEYFIPASQLAEWRRDAVAWFAVARRLACRRPLRAACTLSPTVLREANLDYHANIANREADAYYRGHGARQTLPAYELQPVADAELMRTRYCLRRTLGACLRTPAGSRLPAPLYLQQGNVRLALTFDCARCEMVIKRFLTAK